jgi:phytoene dehydrogenase-like protein
MTDASVDMIIIGAGVAGLAAGCYAQMNGYHTQIFELHDQPGGLCTAWERKGYTFDGCLYYLFGSGKGQPFYQLWQELGVIQGQSFIHHDEFMQITEYGGKKLSVYIPPLAKTESPHASAGLVKIGVQHATLCGFSCSLGKPVRSGVCRSI